MIAPKAEKAYQHQRIVNCLPYTMLLPYLKEANQALAAWREWETMWGDPVV